MAYVATYWSLLKGFEPLGINRPFCWRTVKSIDLNQIDINTSDEKD